MNAIVYTSNAGHTKQYAQMLGRALSLRVYDLKEAKRVLPKGSQILYMGWVMAGTLKGYAAAQKRYCLKAVCAVSMTGNKKQLDEMKTALNIPSDLPVFGLRGGFEIDKLSGLYRLMMNFVRKMTEKKASGGQSPTPEEEEMLSMMSRGENSVCVENLHELLEWYGKREADV